MIEGMLLFSKKVVLDQRGKSCKIYSKEEREMDEIFVSYSKKNVIRGIHFQEEPFSQQKIVTVMKGRIKDIVIDLRPDSKTFLEVNEFELDEKAGTSLLIPKGCGHGFLALEQENIVLYEKGKYVFKDILDTIKHNNLEVENIKKDEESGEITYVEDADQMNVLVFSEDAGIRKGMSAVLQQLNVEQVEATSGYEMETALQEQEFSHVFIEYSKFDDVKELLDMAGNAKPVLMLRSRQLMNRREYMASVQQPFSCMNVADALSYTAVRGNRKSVVETYYAPNARILAVDDNMINLQVIVGLLQPHKIKVDTADGGRECLRMVKKHQYDLILMDHVMPEMGGIETLRAIRNMESEHYKNVPVVAVTATAMNGIREMFEAAGFQAYIPKPIDIKQLEEVVLRFVSADKIMYGAAETEEDAETTLYIPGVDTAAGIAQCGGNRKNYLALLQIVVTDGRKKLELLERCRESQNYETYRIEVHALKSVAASIGAMELSRIALDQENACKEARFSEVNANHRKLCSNYNMVLDHIEVALDDKEAEEETKEASNIGYTKEQFRDKMIMALALMHDFEEDVAMRLLQELNKARLTSEERKLVEELLQKAELFLYDEAQEQIEAYLNGA